jgi:cation:H+ antiporter
MSMSAAGAAWLQFSICAALIAVAGTQLSRYGDVISEKTGLSGAWIGAILMASVTSLPELVTGISSVALANAPDIAVGNALGACVINLAMLVVLDLFYRRAPIFAHVGQGHILSAGFGVVGACFVGLNILFVQYGLSVAVGFVGLYSPMILLLYVIAMRALFRHETGARLEPGKGPTERYASVTLRQAILRYALAAVVVVGAGLWLPYVGQALAKVMGWEQAFVGTLFVAFATTLPEITVTIAAVRIGALDLALGNLLGSNLFNLTIIAVDDLFYMNGPLLDDVSMAHAASALSAAMMSGAIVVGLMYRPRARVIRTVGWTSIFLLAIYLLNAIFFYVYSSRLI